MSLRLEKSICRGARFNNKTILGMKLNGYFLYPSGLFTLIYTTTSNTMASTFYGVTSADYDAEIVYNNNGTYTVSIYFKDMNKQPTRVRIDDDATRVESFNHTTSLTSMKGLFPASAVYINTSEIDTTNVTDMQEMFGMCKSLTSVDLSNFNTSNVTNMSYMFYSCDNLTSINTSSFNTVNVTDMEDMFSHCKALTSLDLSNWDVSNVTKFDSMFEGCTSLKTLDLRNWQMPSVSVTKMLYRCTALTELRLDNCNRDTLINIVNDYYYFPQHNDTTVDRVIYCNETTATGMTAPQGWRFEFVSEETDEPEIPDVPEEPDEPEIPEGRKVYEPYEFKDNEELITANPIVNSTHTDLTNMFYRCIALTSIDTSDWDTSNVTTMSWMFYGCLALSSLDLSDWDTSNATNMFGMFDGCQSLTSLDLSSFDTSDVFNMYGMFYGCSSLTSLNLSNFDMTNVTNTNYMFYNCTSLTELRLDNCNNTTINKIITSTNFPTFTDGTSHIIYCEKSNATGLTAPQGWTFSFVSEPEEPNIPEAPANRTVYVSGEYQNNTTITEAAPIVNSTHTSLISMFDGCTALQSVYSYDWDTSNVTNMGYMFYGCSKLTSLDLSSFNTSKVTGMGSMFRNCTSLTTLDIRNFDTSNVTSIVNILRGCTSLTEIRLDNCNDITVKTIVGSSSFPTFTDGSTHTIYCKEASAMYVTAPTGWTFSYV